MNFSGESTSEINYDLVIDILRVLILVDIIHFV